MNSAQLKEIIRGLFFNRAQRPYLIALVLALVLGLFWDLQQNPKPEGETIAATPESADTMIPAGFVLVPIEVQNFESLDSILGQYGIVDLYQPPLKPGGKPFRVASHIKILRAPLNPSHFAVLAKEADSASLLTSQIPFTVIVQRSITTTNKDGTTIEDPEVATEALRKKNSHPLQHKPVSRITVEVKDAHEDNRNIQNGSEI